MATGGVLARTMYRLTTHGLFVSGGFVTTKVHEVPLWAVRDIDMNQGTSQKLRGVGTIILHVEHADYTGRATVELANIESPSLVRELIREHARRERLRHDQRR
jgi:hypothetical protein